MAKRVSAQLFVSRLSAYATDQSLRQLFSQFGQIKEARLIRDSKTQRPKGFGFITYESEDDARKAMKSLDGKIVDGRLIFVEVAKNAEDVTMNINSSKADD
ncbi:hypothetical protein CARUB_v10018300mg [Capsella rubella]|uniref:RRM domain-containing protein n=1 Tax=Capsella rubella TaxID=81985 RepID=R0FR24_9BRAS|nr:cold-inducible RNA-binding protein [Capsella rubella]EOA25002.1 hypothetical protein CARUB_v10018300mg [Capsella rubella]